MSVRTRLLLRTVFVALCAMVCVFALGRGVAHLIAPFETVTRTRAPSPQATEGASLVSKERNEPHVLSTSPPEGPRRKLTPADVLDAPACPKISASIISESSSDSLAAATLRVMGGSGRLARLGDVVEGLSVLAIGTHPRTRQPTVWMKNDRETLCQSGLYAPPKESASPANRTRARDEESESPDLSEGIRSIGERGVEVDRGFLQTQLSNFGELARSVRAIPYRTMGDVSGWRIVSIRAGSALSRLGLQKFDVIRSVNGISLSSPEELLGAYGKLGEAERVEIALLREGQQQTLEVHVVP